MKITYNEFRKTYSVGWDYNYGCARHAKTFYTIEEVVNFLKSINADLTTLKHEADASLFNGL